MDKRIEDYLPLYLGCECQLFWRYENGELEYERDGTLVTIQPENKDQYGLSFKCKTDHGNYIEYAYPYSDVKPVLRKLSDMSEEDLKDIFKQVTLFDLSDCQLLYGKEENEFWCNAEKAGRVIDSISYDYNFFEMMNNDGSFHPLNPQAEAIKYLLSKHFDLFGLIEAGLAIDSTSLK